MTKLHIFDMDGTLLQGSACLELSRRAGVWESVCEIERRWERGEVGHVAFYELCLPLWAGIDAGDVQETFAACTWLSGVREVWADIRARGEHSAVITLSPQFFADRLLEWGVESVHGALVRAGVRPDPRDVLTPMSKVLVADHLRSRYGLKREDCVAYGDSASDLPLFGALPNSVAVNASESARRVAAASYDGGDLRGAYAAGRRLLEQREGDRLDALPSWNCSKVRQ